MGRAPAYCTAAHIPFKLSHAAVFIPLFGDCMSRQVPVLHEPPSFSTFLCLSRACLDKMMHL
jgi:hypothetical protein